MSATLSLTCLTQTAGSTCDMHTVRPHKERGEEISHTESPHASLALDPHSFISF